MQFKSWVVAAACLSLALGVRPAQAAPIITGAQHGTTGIVLQTQQFSGQTTFGDTFFADATQTTLTDFSFFLITADSNAFNLTGGVAPFDAVTHSVTGPITFFANPTLTTVGSDTQVTFQTGGLSLLAGQEVAVWVTGAFLPTGVDVLDFSTATTSNPTPAGGIQTVFTTSGVAFPNLMATSSGIETTAFVANFAPLVGAPEVDAGSAAVPLALLGSLLLTVTDRRRSVTA